MTKVIEIIHPPEQVESDEIHEGIIWLARIMDDAFVLPGTNIRFGLDPILGLLPGVGDAIGALLGYFMLQEAKRLGASRWLRARMVTNYVIDGVVGVVPLVGDLFDAGFKAHRKNLKLLQDHVAKKRRAKQRERLDF
jgi:hypothetical protein